MRRIANVEEEAVALAGAARETNRGIHGDVVALRWSAVFLGPDHLRDHFRKCRTQRRAISRRRRAGRSALLDETVEKRIDDEIRYNHLLSEDVGDERASSACGRHLGDMGRRGTVPGWLGEIVEDAWRAYDRRLLRMRERNLDDFDAEARRVGILLGSIIHATGQFGRRAYPGRTGHVHINVLGILGIDEDRVRVRAAARLNVRDVLRVRDVGDVEDANAANALLADRFLHALAAAVDAARLSLRRDEEQVPVDRDIALRCGAIVPDRQRRVLRIGDVPDLITVVVALDRVLAEEGKIRVRAALELALRRRRREQTEGPG